MTELYPMRDAVCPFCGNPLRLRADGTARVHFTSGRRRSQFNAGDEVCPQSRRVLGDPRVPAKQEILDANQQALIEKYAPLVNVNWSKEYVGEFVVQLGPNGECPNCGSIPCKDECEHAPGDGPP